MSTPQDEMRAEFEAWAKREGYDTLFVEGGVCGNSGGPVYSDSRTHAAWWSYQAATAAQAEALAAVKAELSLAQERATWLVAQIRDTQEACGVLQTALAAAQEDTARLTWIAHQDLEDLAMGLVVDADHDGEYFVSPDSGGTFYGKTLRAAIDAARATLTPTAPGAQEQA